MEFVFVVRRHDLFERDCPQGFERLPRPLLEEGFLSVIRRRGFFVERRHAEGDASLKQIIPYCVVVDATKKDGDARALRLRRLPKQGERRLHDKLSIGIGGHLNPIDRGEHEPSILDRGVLRELSEELDLRFPGAVEAAPVPLGVLNDDSTPVGSVHFGIVYGIAASPDTTIRERDHMTGDWTSWNDLRAEQAAGANFETWSSILLRSLSARDLREVAGASASESQHSESQHSESQHSDRARLSKSAVSVASLGGECAS